MMPAFFIDSSQCKSHLHCTACRDLRGGRRFRRSLLRTFGGEDINFKCEYRPWGYQTDPSDLPAPGKPGKPPPVFVAERKALCGVGGPVSTSCDGLSDDGTYCETRFPTVHPLDPRHTKHCQCGKLMRAFLHEPSSECPSDHCAAVDDAEDKLKTEPTD